MLVILVLIGGLLLGAANPIGSFTSVHSIECELRQLVRSTPGSDFKPISHPNGGPRRIILMRHADKPDDPDDPDLSAAGAARAQRLAAYVLPGEVFSNPAYHGKRSSYAGTTARCRRSHRCLARQWGVTQIHGQRMHTTSSLISATTPILAAPRQLRQ